MTDATIPPPLNDNSDAMIVYRVEDGEGAGPYRCSVCHHPEYDPVLGKRTAPHNDDAIRPIDYDLSTVCMDNKQFLFGFETPEDAFRWFDPFTDYTGRGFDLYVYRAIEGRHGKRQLIFNRDKAVRLGLYSQLC